MSRRDRGSNASGSIPDPDPDPDNDEPTPPFFNTTFSTHRVSPLYVGPEQLTNPRLEILARRLRDTLVGDVVRGIQIGLESTDTPSGQVGPLKSVKLRWFRANMVLGDEVGGAGHDEEDSVWDSLAESQKQGLWIEILHENAAYIALLLPSVGDAGKRMATTQTWQMQPGGQAASHSNARESHFIHLPLLLLRMPLPLKNVIGEWLSATFDCRVSKLALGTRTLVHVWEDWIRTVGVRSNGPDFVVTLAFNAPLPDPSLDEEEGGSNQVGDSVEDTKPGLRSVDITIQPQDLRRFARAGKGLAQRPKVGSGVSWENDIRQRRRLAGGNSDDGWAWLSRESDTAASSQPFTDALARYLDHHLALNLFHPSVRIAQISCGGFVLASGRLKVVRQGDMSDDLSRAAWMFATRLGQRISGEALPAIFT
ncbi:hypothetical protein ACRE_080720 [Hapsidospora chrysogenum ATCC 11550]|uniref:Siroheme synthase n=1 Tax=Hapsidospora chrysogenum (strain ATCC 11550 / CBS 779.69 / DSM 880 / IAM 14645 / JCM 23072 / IMI 49137) TaxID=857340 RepID=A0A086SVT1_HAPC1|nr:hypothetical protein ACRE_080720 [Hapsidospora chrysogenum ATCC 11550]